VYGQFKRGEFAFDENQMFLSSNEYFICSKTINLKILLALLNSKICYFYGTTIMNSLGGNTTIAQKDIFIKTPIAINLNKKLETQIEKFISDKDYNSIDILIYEIYGLDIEEISFIKNVVI
jgi:hypothetical protein